MVAELWEKVGDHWALIGEGDKASESYHQAITALQDSPATWVMVRFHRKTAGAFLSQHNADMAEPHLASAETLLGVQDDAAERGRLLRLRAHWLWSQGRHADALAPAEESVRLAERYGSPADVATAYQALALVCHSLGQWKRGLHCEIRHLGASADDPQVAYVFDAHH